MRRGCSLLPQGPEWVGLSFRACLYLLPAMHRSDAPLTGCQVGAFFLVYQSTHCDTFTFPNIKHHTNQTIDMSRLTSLIHNITLLQFIAIITKLPGKAMPEWSAYRGSTTVEEFHVLDVPTTYCILVLSRVMDHKHTIHPI